jgi:hypothetical protein
MSFLVSDCTLETGVSLSGLEASWNDDVDSNNHLEQLGYDFVSWAAVGRSKILMDLGESFSGRVKLHFQGFVDLKLEDNVRILGVSLSQWLAESEDETVVDPIIVRKQESFDHILVEDFVVKGRSMKLHVVHVQISGVFTSWNHETQTFDSGNQLSHILIDLRPLSDGSLNSLGEGLILSLDNLLLRFGFTFSFGSFFLLLFLGFWFWNGFWNVESDITEDIVVLVEVFEWDIHLNFVSSVQIGIFDGREVDSEFFLI